MWSRLKKLFVPKEKPVRERLILRPQDSSTFKKCEHLRVSDTPYKVPSRPGFRAVRCYQCLEEIVFPARST